MMSDVDNGISLSSTTDEIQDHSGMMDFQTLLQQLPTSSAPQNITIEESGGIKRIKIVPSSSSTVDIPTSTIEMSSSLLRPMPSIASSSSSLATSPSLVSSSGVAASLPGSTRTKSDNISSTS